MKYMTSNAATVFNEKTIRFSGHNGGGAFGCMITNPGEAWRLRLEAWTDTAIKMRVAWQLVKLTK